MIAAILACQPLPAAHPRGADADDSTAPLDSAPSPATGDTGRPGGCVPELEIPGDGVDQACNGWTDELGVGESAAAAAAYVARGEGGDRFGMSMAAGTDRDGVGWLAIGGMGVSGADVVPPDGVYELWVHGHQPDYGNHVGVTHWDAMFIGTAPDRVHVFLGPGELDAGSAFNEDSYAELIGATSGFRLVDLDGDGGEEMLTSGGDGIHAFAAVTADGFGPERFLITSETPPSQNFAYTLGEVGDLTGDGVPELTAYQEDDDVGGRAYILPSTLSGIALNTDIGWSLAGWEYGTAAGLSIALGDVDGDGYLDLLTGAPLAQGRGGVSYVYPGPIVADGFLADGFARFEPLYPHDQCSYAVEVLPDQDGDGTDEVAIGCFNESWVPGRVELYAGAIASGTLDAWSASRVLVGIGGFEGTGADSFGAALSAHGDATGDGVPDLLVGAPLTGEDGAGAVFVFASPVL